ncbi:MAG: hypothetical protein WBD07_03180 [Vicinamibacterales bacterium]
MKERLFPAIFVLGLVSGVQSAGMARPGSLGSQVEGKVIANPEELAAYTAARAITDPRMKAAALEAFARTYPDSLVKIDALEEAMAAYQQLSDRTQIERVGRLVLSVDAENLRALTAVIPLERARITAGNGAVQLLNQLRDHAALGLAALPNWTKPAGMTDAEFTRLASQMSLMFAGAAGFGALQARDYAAARSYYASAVTLDPSNLENVYQLGLAQLNVQPIDVTGFWYLARAAFLARTAGAGRAEVDAAVNSGKGQYQRFHGRTDDWDTLVAATAAAQMPPGDFAARIAPVPPGCASFEITGPETVKAGEPLVFTVKLTGGPAQVKPVFEWAVSPGTIDAGQGSAQITVDTKDLARMPVIVTVEVIGFEASCPVGTSSVATVSN